MSDPRPSFALPARSQWEGALKDIAENLRAVPNPGLPLPDGTRQPAFTIYAGNQFGEGGIVAPARGDATMKLKAIQAVFGPAY